MAANFYFAHGHQRVDGDRGRSARPMPNSSDEIAITISATAWVAAWFSVQPVGTFLQLAGLVSAAV
jgi:hypothetical protein